MRILFIGTFSLYIGVANASGDLASAIQNAYSACGNISNELSDMKTMAGINTAVTAVGTVAGGVALGTGIAKSGVDREIEELKQEIEKLMTEGKNTPIEPLSIENPTLFQQQLSSFATEYSAQLEQKQQELSKAEQKSKTLGNIRTGTLATATATNIAGAVIAGTNRVKGDLKTQIDTCLASIQMLSTVRIQARLSQTASDADLDRAEKIINACNAWDTVDISSINNKSTGATISSGIGAGLGLAGTITSASANSKSVRDGDESKEKKLNNAANVLAGGTTLASGVATIFNATQINAIKRAVTAAEECEGALR